MDIVDEIGKALSRHFGSEVRLEPLGRQGKSLTFRMSVGDGAYFVKYPDDSVRVHAVLAAADGCRFLPPSPFAEPFRFRDGCISCHAWCASDAVPPERWNDRQLASFADAYAELSAVLQRTGALGAREDDEGCFETIRTYAKGHALRSLLLRRLLAIPPGERTYGADDRLCVIHGDLHSSNYGFRGDSFAFFYDVDNVLSGFAADDLAYTVLDRAQRMSTTRAEFAHCVAVLRYLRGRFGGEAREWRIAINRKRIRQAASKIGRWPHLIQPALAIAMRDARATRLMEEAGLCD